MIENRLDSPRYLEEKYTMLDLLGLQTSLFSENYLLKSDKQASMRILVSSSRIGFSDIYNCVSSAYNNTDSPWARMISSTGEIYRLKSNGSKTDPCL